MAMIAALPMYDWPEVRHETDAEWNALRIRLSGIIDDLPLQLIRTNSEMPPVPGGILSGGGDVLAPDPVDLPPDELDFHTLWRHPDLVLAQTCWGPMELGLDEHVQVIGQPDYSEFEGGQGEFYRSAILMRAESVSQNVPVPADANANFDPQQLKGKRFAFNGTDSMSGYIALRRDLAASSALANEAEFEQFWTEMMVSGGHRQSVVAVADGRADVATIDCRTLDLCRRFEPATSDLRVAGWTAQRLGLPYIAAPGLAQPFNLSSQG